LSQPGVNVAIIDYDFGNVRSVANALESLGASVQISRDKDVLQAADALILPGVGAFGDGMANLKGFGLISILEELVLWQKKPFLGICVGMQLLAQTGFEGGEQAGLGWLDAEVIRLETPGLKVPHVGWNDVRTTQSSNLLGDVGAVHSYYFVHSYHLRCRDESVITGVCEYGVEFPAVIEQGNIFAVQFHPEKSQKHGLQLLSNFLALAQTTGSTAAC